MRGSGPAVPAASGALGELGCSCGKPGVERAKTESRNSVVLNAEVSSSDGSLMAFNGLGLLLHLPPCPSGDGDRGHCKKMG